MPHFECLCVLHAYSFHTACYDALLRAHPLAFVLVARKCALYVLYALVSPASATLVMAPSRSVERGFSQTRPL